MPRFARQLRGKPQKEKFIYGIQKSSRYLNKPVRQALA